jgi:hypothetical protein
MSCLGPFYNPIPTREWSRVQNECTYFNGSPPATITVPQLNITVPIEVADYYKNLLRKGNVLQYKKNSSNLTKSQRYSKIANGMWTNRNTTWATQTDRYSNPNTLSLKRVGTVNINLDGSSSSLPVTCPTNPVVIDNILPVNVIQTGNNPIIPPPPPPPPADSGGDSIPIVPIDTPVTPTVVADLGNLLCNTTENICTGETQTRLANKLFYPTTDSDVPGVIQELYWNPRIQTWYPRQRLNMNNSTDKWPINSKFIFPIKIFKS